MSFDPAEHLRKHFKKLADEKQQAADEKAAKLAKLIESVLTEESMVNEMILPVVAELILAYRAVGYEASIETARNSLPGAPGQFEITVGFEVDSNGLQFTAYPHKQALLVTYRSREINGGSLQQEYPYAEVTPATVDRICQIFMETAYPLGSEH